MGQYHRLVNASTQEYVELPGLVKAIERITNPVAMGMVGYLLLEGPLDGTGPLLGMATERDLVDIDDGIASYIEREKEIEDKCFQEDLEDPPDYRIRIFERETGLDFSSSEGKATNGEEFEKFCRKRSRSIYRKENLNWDRKKIARVVMAGLQINEGLEYAGRWAGDEVYLSGDYSDLGYYQETKETWRYEHQGEEFVTYATASCPIIPSSIEREDIVHSVRDREPEPGDLAQVRKPGTDERVYAHYLGVEPGTWENITDGLTEEFVSIVGSDWIEGHDQAGIMAPDMVLSVD